MTPDTAAAYGEGYEAGEQAGLIDGREQGARQTRGEIVGHLYALARTYESQTGTTAAPYGREQGQALRLAADLIRNGEL